MWATSALPWNGRLPAVGCGREALANDAHVSMFVKIAGLPKKVKKREVTWNFGESPPNSNGIGLHTGMYVLWLRYGGKS
jgi:hypothetical protein